MFRDCVIDFKWIWDDNLPLIKFTLNKSFCSSIQIDPNEALYGCRYMLVIGWFEAGKASLILPDSVHKAMEKVKIIRIR